jgi:hypothetical protein
VHGELSEKTSGKRKPGTFINYAAKRFTSSIGCSLERFFLRDVAGRAFAFSSPRLRMLLASRRAGLVSPIKASKTDFKFSSQRSRPLSSFLLCAVDPARSALIGMKKKVASTRKFYRARSFKLLRMKSLSARGGVAETFFSPCHAALLRLQSSRFAQLKGDCNHKV